MERRLVPEHLCGVEEIARTFRVSPATVRNWIDSGLPCILIGNKWQGRYDEIWEWLKNAKVLKAVK